MLGKLYFLLVTLICFSTVKNHKIQYLDVANNFNTFKLLEGIRDSDINPICKGDVATYINGVKSSKYWALMMFDSSAKVPDGLIKGNSYILGDYDDCIQSEQPDSNFLGQHCMVTANIVMDFDNFNGSSQYGHQLLDDDHVGSSIEYGMCLPSTCTGSDIANGINQMLKSTILEGMATVIVHENKCRTKEPSSFNIADWLAILILIGFGVITLASTVYDYYHQRFKKGKPHPLFISFSIYTNGQSLFQTNDSSAQLKVLHGIRVLSMSWIVLHHAVFWIYRDGQTEKSSDFLKVTSDVNHIVLTTGLIAVDTFFFLSGLLACTVFFRDIDKKGYYDVPMGYIHRYLRLTPTFAAMMLFVATLFMYIGDGPYWNIYSMKETETCWKSWWSGLLYIQNFVDPNSNCVRNTWYLSTDMNLFWLSPLVLYPMYYWPACVPSLLGILILATACTNMAVGYTNDLGASLMTVPLSKYDFQFQEDYSKFYMRAAPYLIGIALGYIIHKTRVNKIKIELNKIWVIIGWFTCAGLCLGSLYGIIPFTGQQNPALEASIYLALNRITWASGLAWLVFTCIHGYGGPINTFLSWNVFQVLGKLSYNVYLIHGMIQVYRFGTMRTHTHTGDLVATYDFLGDYVLSNLIAIPLTLIIEIPFGNLDRYFFQKVKIAPFPRIKKNANNPETGKKEELNMA